MPARVANYEFHPSWEAAQAKLLHGSSTTGARSLSAVEWMPDPPATRRLQKACAQTSDCEAYQGCGYCSEATDQCDATEKSGDPCGPSNTGQCLFGYCSLPSTSSGDCGNTDCNTCNEGNCFPIDEGPGNSCTEGGVQGTCEWDPNKFLKFDCKTGTVANDPIIGGFDGKKFHFDEVGNYTLLQEGGGWKVGITFSSAPKAQEEGVESRESSWTTAVRVHNPQGDLVSCSVPAVYPNTSLVQMYVTPGGGEAQLMTAQHAEAALHQMTASPTLSWKEYAGVQYSTVVGCKVSTPLMDINIYQVSGWAEAQARPEEHGWAAPFTWLNMDFEMKQRLAAPVTGILGDTYPKEAAVLTATAVGGDELRDASASAEVGGTRSKKRGKCATRAPPPSGFQA